MVSEVTGEAVGAWRFDPASGELRVPIEPARAEPFSILIHTQRAAGSLPADLPLAPVRVSGAAGELGSLAVAFGDDAQPVSETTVGLSPANPEPALEALVPENATLHRTFRYGPAEASLHLRVAEVEPELRAEIAQFVSLGEDRLVVAADLGVEIARSGVFRIEVALPPELVVESVTGRTLAHWNEVGSGTGRRLVLHLAEKTLGRADFRLTLSGATPEPADAWPVPRVAVSDAARVRGTLAVAPERGYQVGVASRHDATQIDPETLRREGSSPRPGAIGFRLLGAEWNVALAIEKLDPWVAVRILHEATFHEGLVAEHLDVAWRIENAGVKALRLRIPGLAEADADTLRATGPSVADLVPVEGAPETWELRFERSMAGEARARISFRRRADTTSVVPVEALGVRQISYFAAVRAGGRLEAAPADMPAGWQRIDASQAKAELGELSAGGLPALLFRVSDPAGPLPLALTRHGLAGARQVRIVSADLKTLLSPAGHALTAAELHVELARKETLRLSLPAGVLVFSVRVNDEPVALVRDGDEWLFHVSPPPRATGTAAVSLVFSAPVREALRAPAFDAPMERIAWRVLVPEGWELSDPGGDLEQVGRRSAGKLDLRGYRALAADAGLNGSRDAVAMLDQAQAWLRNGEPAKAELALRHAARGDRLDAASNEDARVQLHQLMTREAVLGLNTRRQRLVVGHEATGGPADPQLERAASANPLLRGGERADLRELDRLLEGNSAEQTTALKEIANRIVAQQLAGEPTPDAVEVTLPESGTIYEFSRGVQLQDDRPMTLEIELERAAGGGLALALLGCLAVGLFVFRHRTNPRATR